MSLTCRVLGPPGRDNAVLVPVDSGQAVASLPLYRLEYNR